jgi:hypothetical protein
MNPISTAFFIFFMYYSGAVLAQQNSLQRFLNGERLTYSTAENPKAKGIQMSFDYPSSWGGADGRRPNTLYQVTSEKGKGLELCNLVIKDLNLPPGTKITAQDIEELFNSKGLKDFVPPGSQFIAGKRTAIDGQPGAWVQFSQNADRAGVSLQMVWLTYQIYYNRHIINFNCSVGDSGDKSRELVQQRFNYYLPLFQQIANSIIIQSKWR